MNKILVDRDRVICDNNDLIIDNKIVFDSDCDCVVEYNYFDVSLEFVVKNMAKVKLLEVITDDVDVNINNHYVIDNGILEINKFYCSKSVSENVIIDLNKSGSIVRYNFSNVCKTCYKYRIDVNHNDIKTESYINNKGVSLNNSILDFVINSYVPRGMIGSIVNQNTRIVTLGDSKNNICPNMYILEEDVLAKHGSIIGNINDEMLFYLMSRGISYREALFLLIKGYLFSNVNVPYDIRRKIMDLIYRYWR